MELYEPEFMNQQQENEYNNVKDIIKNGKPIDLIKIEKEYFYNMKIQSAIIKRYIAENMYRQAKTICQKNESYDVIQSQLVTIYIKEKRFDEAIEICNRFPNMMNMQNQLVTIYVQKREYDRAIEICNKFIDYNFFKSQLVKIYIYQNKLEEAIKICKQYPYLDAIQSQLITIYLMLNEEKYNEKLLEQAEKIGERLLHDETIQYQLLTVYLKLNKFDRAVEICQKFPDNKLIQNKYKELRNYKKTYNDDALQERINTLVEQDNEHYKKDGDSKILSLEQCINNPILDEIRTKLVNGTIEVKDIELLKKLESDIDSDIYKFIMIAIYHKLGLLKSALQVLKTIDKKYNKYKETLYSMLAGKKSKIYNLGFYDEIINWHSISEVTKKTVVKVKKA